MSVHKNVYKIVKLGPLCVSFLSMLFIRLVRVRHCACLVWAPVSAACGMCSPARRFIAIPRVFV